MTTGGGHPHKRIEMAQRITNEVTIATFPFIEDIPWTAYFLYDFRMCCKKKIQNEIQNPLALSFPQWGEGDNSLIFSEFWNIKIRTELNGGNHAQ